MGAFENAIREGETFDSLLELYRESLDRIAALESQLAARDAEIERLRAEIAAFEKVGRAAGKIMNDGLQKEAEQRAEIERLRGRLALFEELCGYMRGPIEVARKSLPLRVAGEPRNVDIYWHTSEDSLDLFDAAVALVAEGRRRDGL